MPTSYSEEPVTTALITLLATLGFPVGDHRAPADATADKPYLVVHFIGPGGPRTGSLADPEADTTLVYQVDAVGRRRDQAQKLGDKVRNLALVRGASGSFTAAFPAMTGLVCHDRITEGSAGVIVEGEAPNEVYTFPERYRLAITPA